MYTMAVRKNSVHRPNSAAGVAAAVLILLLPLCGRAGASDPAAGPASAAPLPVDEVVNNLVRKNAERSRNLLHSESTRIYRLTYRGFPSDREAEMTVAASYDSPAKKEFQILSQSGSKLILDRVFKKLLESEQESIRPEMSSQTRLDRDNYDFALAGYEASADQYVLEVTPKRKSKFVYRGKIWVDGKDFAVTRIEAEPAQNPSFWTKRSEIHHEYQKIQNSWLPVKNQSISYIRLGGRATLTIEYKDYRLTEADGDVAAMSRSPRQPDPASAVGATHKD